MLGHILISGLLIGGLAGLFALSLWFVRRTDRSPGCGGEGCAQCGLNAHNEGGYDAVASERTERRSQ